MHNDSTPNANRTRIAFFGRRNAGKSSLINALTGQPLAIVSDVPGTTTDPVSKAMEILPLGPCLVTDTAGLDDEGDLGLKRVEKSLAVLELVDIAVLAIPVGEDELENDRLVRETCAKRGVVLIVVRTKSDLAQSVASDEGEIALSCRTLDGLEIFRDRLAKAMPLEKPAPLVADLINRGDIVVCVCPIDAAAPKGRLILPQQQVIRELIDNGASAVVCQPSELKGIVERLSKTNIRFVITDSQAFKEVDSILDKDIELTSFSIVFARQKGDLKTLCEGASAIMNLQDGDRVLIAEGCTHRRQCGDIGTEKIPRLLKKFTGRNLDLTFASGGDFPLDENNPPKLVIHCGGCMLTRRAVMNRLSRCTEVGVPIVNYGVAIALMNGIETKDGSCMVKR
ncbi:MAG: [FeFe] hydrogenase H-cluster maturation GTPase HydF [Kiritimatiellae bacterium]|nr:[FeFe] hydrogenase H-cluster maturation GTPase HydF [Kiritimatiellia bacterium]